MFQSRCGVCCDACGRKEGVDCKGCINMKKPFWGGTCYVKSCCENKGLDHCGQCGEFPCGTLSEMGTDQGFDPELKILQCRKWAEEEI